MEHDIFISYSRRDSQMVDQFVKRLEQEGFRVWIDRDGIESGDAFKRVIVRAIKESEIVVFFSSEPSNTSIWTAKEINIAVHYNKPIIPIKLDNSVYNDEVEFDLVSLDYIDYTIPETRPAMMEKLVRTLKSKLRGKQRTVTQDDTMAPPTTTQPMTPPPAPAAQTPVPSAPITTKKKGRKGLWIALAIVTVAVVAAIVLVPKFLGDRQSAQTDSSSAYTDLNFTVNGVSFVMKPVVGDTVATFYMGETEVTQELWVAVTGKEPEYEGGWSDKYGRGGNYPAYYVSWNEISGFLRQLNSMTGKNFRLPTEKEWEYAACGGMKANGYLYAGSNHVEKVAWYNKNSDNTNHVVKSLQPNELGLYDMSGNVWEWCSDLFEPEAKDSMRVLRGGGSNRNADRCQVTYRGSGGPDFRGNSHGFRLAL